MIELVQTPPRVELSTYESALPSILATHRGQYVVIQGTRLLQYFDEYTKALDWAYENLELDSFFVKRVEPAELSTVHFTRDLG
jgi:hypothetical protein